MARRCAFCVLLCLLLAIPAFSQQADTRLSLDRCVQITLKNNFTLKESLETLLEKEADYYIARNTLATKVSVAYGAGTNSNLSSTEQMSAGGELTYKMPEGDTITAYAQALRSNATTRGGHDVGLEYRYPLARGGGLIVGSQEIRKAQRNLTIQELTYFISKQEAVSDVIYNYFTLLESKKLIDVNAGSVEAAGENLRITKRKFDEGLVPKIDLTRAEILYVTAQDGLLSARKTWSDKRDVLLRSMGLDPRQAADINYEVPYVPRDFLEDECVELSMVLRKELLVTGEQLFQNKENVTIAKNALQPQVDLVTSYSSARTEFLTTGVEVMSYPSWFTGVECSINISKRSLREDLLRTKRLVELSREKLANQQLGVVKEVRDALRLVRLAASRVELREKNLKAAEERLHLATRSWEEGLITNREVVDAQQDKVNAQTALLQAKVAYILAEYGLRKAVGYDLAHIIRQEDAVRQMPENGKTGADPYPGAGAKKK